MKRINLFLAFILLLGVMTSYAQYSDDNYTVNITGVPYIILDYVYNPGENSDHSFDMDNNLGTYYPGDDGVISIPLKRGHYQYMAVWDGRKMLNGSFYIDRRNVYFKVRYFPPYFGIDSRKALDKGYQYFNDKKKKDARKMFYIAAEAGDADGMYAYAHMCYNGMGGSKNKNHAYVYMKMALEHGHPYATDKLEHFKNKYQWFFP